MEVSKLLYYEKKQHSESDVKCKQIVQSCTNQLSQLQIEHDTKMQFLLNDHQNKMKQFDLPQSDQQAQELIPIKQLIMEDLTQQFYIKVLFRLVSSSFHRFHIHLFMQNETYDIPRFHLLRFILVAPLDYFPAKPNFNQPPKLPSR